MLLTSGKETLSNEEIVKLRHLLEDNMKGFFVLLSVSQVREIELAIAKLLDINNNRDRKLKNHQDLLKISILKIFHSQRLKGNVKLKKNTLVEILSTFNRIYCKVCDCPRWVGHF